jgi:adenylate kinase
VCAELHRILGLRFKSNAPRRPPRVIIAGPPGTGKDTQAKLLAKKFGLVHISARALLKNEMQTNKDAAESIRTSLDTGEPVAEDVMNSVIEKRIKQGDCKVNGFVLEGYPYSKTQITYIRSWKIKPSVLFMFGATADFK